MTSTSTTPAEPGGSTVEALRPGKPPVGTGASPLVAQLVAVALVALGVVAVQHLLATLGAIEQASWAVTVLQSADGIDGSSGAVLAVAVVLVVVGLLLLPVALRPRPRRGLAVEARTGVDLRPRDLERVLHASLEGIDAVSGVDVDVRGRRKVRVKVTSVAGESRDAEITSTVRERVDPVLAALESTPRTDVSIRHDDQVEA